MFSNNKNELIKAQNSTIVAQAESLKVQTESIKFLNMRLELAEKELKSAQKDIESRDSRIDKLCSYFKDLGINLPKLEDAGIWWPQAKKLIILKVEEDGAATDQTSVTGIQTQYAIQVAKSIIGSTISPE